MRIRLHAAVAALLLLGAGRALAEQAEASAGSLEVRGGFGRHGLLLGAAARGRSGRLAASLAGEMELVPVMDPAVQAPEEPSTGARLRAVASLGFVLEAPLRTDYLLAGSARPTRLRGEVAAELGLEGAFTQVNSPSQPEQVQRSQVYRIPFAGLRVGGGLAVGGGAVLVSAYVRRELGPRQCLPAGAGCEPLFETVGGVVLSAVLDLWG